MIRSLSLPAPLRVLILLTVVGALVLATLAPALADMHPAADDGQRLEDQSADVQATYRAVYGDDAAAKWIEDHNAAIAITGNMYYHRIVAVAKARIEASKAMSMDMDMGMGDDMSMGDDMGMGDDMKMGDDMDMGMSMDLPYRIAADVIGRGTEKAFLAGTDAGVVYGIGIPEDEINKMNMDDTMMDDMM